MQESKANSPQAVDTEDKVWTKPELKNLNCELDDIHAGPGFSIDGGAISNSMS